MTITISVVIPNYNHAQYLPTAINSVLAQTMAAFEILIIDDCSTDNSLAVIQEFMSTNSNIKLLQNEQNQGVIYTLNRGLKEAKGSHVVFVAADDWVESNLIQTATQQLTSYPNCGFWSSGAWIAYEHQPEVQIPSRMIYPVKTSGFISATESLQLLYKIDSWFMGNGLVLNRELALQENGFLPELASFTDNFLYRVLAVKHGCYFNVGKFATWRICKTGYASTFNKNPGKQIQVLRKVIQLLQEQYNNYFNSSIIYRFRGRMYSNLARTIWVANGAKLSTHLVDIIKTSIPNKFLAIATIAALKIVSRIPKLKFKLGQVFLYFSLRPFDLPLQLELLKS